MRDEIAARIVDQVFRVLNERKGLGIEANCNYDDEICDEVRSELERVVRMVSAEEPKLVQLSTLMAHGLPVTKALDNRGRMWRHTDHEGWYLTDQPNWSDVEGKKS